MSDCLAARSFLFYILPVGSRSRLRSYSVTLKGTTVIANGAPYYKPLSATPEGGAMTAFQSNIEFRGMVFFKNNSATRGGAIGVVSSKLSVYGSISICNNTASNSGGGMYIFQSELNCKNGSIVQFVSNSALERGGGIHAIGSTITAEVDFSYQTVYSGSRLMLIDNVATRFGGGMCLENNAKLNVLYLNRVDLLYSKNVANYKYNITFLFRGNSAVYGGALYIADDTTSGTCSTSKFYNTHSTVTECFFQTSKVEKVTSYIHSNKTHTKPGSIYAEFRNNHALKRGSNLYGGLLDRCTQSQFNKIGTAKLYAIDGLEYLLRLSNINTSNSISSDPVQVCFCLQNQPNCTSQNVSVSVFKGERFSVPLVAVDQALHFVSATIHSIPKSNGSGIDTGQLIQSTTNNCTNLIFNVFSSHESEELIVYAEGPCKDAPLSQRSILIHFQTCSCSIGFQPVISFQTKCVCECDAGIAKFVTMCDYETKTFVRVSNSWLSYINSTANFSDYLIYRYCPLDYCKDHSEKTKLNLNSQNGIDEQCEQFRTGTLCGACQTNYSLSLGSSRCIVCPDYWPAMLITVLIAALIAGIILVALILLLNLTVAVGTLNGVIFFANIVNANIQTFIPSSRPSFFSVFISWLNLDIGLDTCFFPGMDAYSKTWLQLVFPTYLMFLVVMVIYISERSR